MSRLPAPACEYLIRMMVMMAVVVMAVIVSMATTGFFMAMIVMMMTIAGLFVVMAVIVSMATAGYFVIMMMTTTILLAVMMATAGLFVSMVVTTASTFLTSVMMTAMIFQKFFYLRPVSQRPADCLPVKLLPRRGDDRRFWILLAEHMDALLNLLVRHHLCSADHDRRRVLYLILEKFSEILKV